MNNQQFRRLVLDNPRPQQDGTSTSPASRPSTTVLGARKHSSISMTPRQVGRNSVQTDFARQLAERNTRANPQKKFKSSAPKGTKLASGYTDRTKERVDDEDDETAKRIKNLEESMKLGQIDRDTFDGLVQEITGGEISSTHLVRGLDRKLLERVRRGEDVLTRASKKEDREGQELVPDMEDEFDDLAQQEVGPIARERAQKKGEKAMMPPPPVVGVKRSRNDILAELKAQRRAAAEAAAAEHDRKYPSLGSGFRKVSVNGETHRIEVDAEGREVLIITGPDGKEKRKVRKQKVEEPTPEIRHDLDDVNKPINMNNLRPSKKEESEDEDIFEGVGSNYNPLAHIDDDDASSSEAEGYTKPPTPPKSKADIRSEVLIQSKPLVSESRDESTNEEEPLCVSPKLSTSTMKPTKKRDYFASTSRNTKTSAPNNSESSTADATVHAALRKVRNLDANSTLLQNLEPDSKEARLKKRAAELAAQDRDMEDIDLGFGGSRFDDAEEMEREGEKVKLSEWKGLGVEGEEAEEHGAKGAKRRKRGLKKQKGDKNKAEDVLKIMERQKEKKTLG